MIGLKLTVRRVAQANDVGRDCNNPHSRLPRNEFDALRQGLHVRYFRDRLPAVARHQIRRIQHAAEYENLLQIAHGDGSLSTQTTCQGFITVSLTVKEY